MRPGALLALGLLVAVAATGCSSTTTVEENSPPTDGASLEIPATDGPGVTASKVVVMDMTLGFFGPNDGYTKYVEALAARLNADGGIGGRDVEIIPTPKLPQPANATSDQVQQAQCAAFASGPEFFTLLGSGYKCLGDKGVVGINNVTMTTQDLATPYLLAPANMSDVRAAATLALRLRADGQLDGVKKIGVITLAGDTSSDPAAADTLVKDLEAGSPDYTVETFQAPGMTEANALSLVVKLKQAGVDFVVPANFFAAGAINAGVFAQQRFYPGISGYGVYISPQMLPSLPADFLARIRQYGWQPSTYTVPAGQGKQLTAEKKGASFCLGIARQAQVSTAGAEFGA